MKINFYYLAHGFFVFNPKQVRDDYREMKGLGADSVTYAILEQDTEFCPITIEKHFSMAHQEGLKVYVIFSRLGGLFAGAPRVASLFSASNPDTLMCDKNGRPYGGGIGVFSCVNNPLFNDFFEKTTTNLLLNYDIDGIILDEPKMHDVPCFCSACRALMKNEDPVMFRKKSLVSFLDRAAVNMKKIKPSIEISLFNDTIYPLDFHNMTAAIPGIDFHGTDGSLAGQWVQKTKIEQIKTPLAEQLKEAKNIAEKHGKKLMAVCENFQTPSSEINKWEESFSKVLEYKPELIVFFYYAPNTDNPEALQEMIRRCCRKITDENKTGG